MIIDYYDIVVTGDGHFQKMLWISRIRSFNSFKSIGLPLNTLLLRYLRKKSNGDMLVLQDFAR